MGLFGSLKSALRVRPRSIIQEKVRKATVGFCIVCEDRGMSILGSGFLAHGSGIVLTAAHVLQGLASKMEELEEEGEQCEPRVMVTQNPRLEDAEEPGAMRSTADATFTIMEEWAVHSFFDLAVVKTGLWRRPERSPSLPINYHRVIPRGNSVGACGYPYGLDPHEGKSILNSYLEGHVSGVAPLPDVEPGLVQHYLLQMPVNPGNSGGPVFSPRTGEVFGVVSRRYQPGGIPSGLCIAVPVHATRAVIEEAVQSVST